MVLPTSRTASKGGAESPACAARALPATYQLRRTGREAVTCAQGTRALITRGARHACSPSGRKEPRAAARSVAGRTAAGVGPLRGWDGPPPGCSAAVPPKPLAGVLRPRPAPVHSGCSLAARSPSSVSSAVAFVLSAPSRARNSQSSTASMASFTLPDRSTAPVCEVENNPTRPAVLCKFATHQCSGRK
jgi:hypothetical protein